MSVALPTFVFVTFALIVWLLVGLFRSRRSQQEAPADSDQPPVPPKRTGSLARVVLFLLFIWLVADVLSISLLGTSNQNTFHYVPAEQQPIQQPKADPELRD